MNQVLTPQELADELKIDKQTIYRYIKRGQIKAVKLGPKIIRILRKDVEWLFPKESI